MSLCVLLFVAGLVHIPHLPRLQELYACQLFVLVSTNQSGVVPENICVFILLPANLCAFFRYVIVECEDQDTQQRDPKTHEMYLNVMRRFSQALLKVRT